jgi:RsiW-degrading membrane proteinase PrsW (M82 family)
MLGHALLALVPVLLFLVGLLLMDSFKLARPSSVLIAIAAGAAAAVACDRAYDGLFQLVAVPQAPFTRYIAPLAEESVKAVIIVYFIVRRRVGFLVDAAQLGFAAGTGFALVENVQYLRDLPDATAVVWLVRGVGTALLHGGTTAVFAMMAKSASDRHQQRKLFAFVPGFVTACVIHSAFNHVLLPPFAMVAVLLLVFPLVILTVFKRSERATREWVVAGLDLDVDLLELVNSELFTSTRMGKYLDQLKARFPGPVVADMFCLLRVQLELAIQAKGMLIAREAGLMTKPHEDAFRAIEEERCLRISIGPTGLLALRPLHVSTHRDAWHQYLLRQPSSVAKRRGRATALRHE